MSYEAQNHVSSRFSCSKTFRISGLAAGLIAGLLTAPAPVLATPSVLDGCHKPMALAAADQASFDLGPGGAGWVEVQVPTSGILRLDVRATITEAQAIVGYWGPSCDTRARNAAVVLDFSPSHQTLEVDPGTAIFRVASLARLEGLVDVRTTFVARNISNIDDPPEDDDETEGDGLGGTIIVNIDDPPEDDDETEGDGLAGTIIVNIDDPPEDDDETEGDGLGGTIIVNIDDPPEDDDETEGDGLSAVVGRLCRRSLGDDHGEFAACATPIGRGGRVNAELGIGDVDVFRLEIPSSRNAQASGLWQARLASTGNMDLSVTIFDERGLRLATNGTDQLQSLVLTAGRYFVRVEARDGGLGNYRLDIATASW